MKYFDKDFFKFTLGFLAIIAISFLIITAVSALAEEGISKIIFTTSPQSVKPNELSSAITIQTQDFSGNSMQTPETIDLEFTVNSATGEFLGSTGNPATKTMNTNTANRTFYYRDSVVGDFTITVNAIGRSSGEKWSVSQDITVSNSVSDISSIGGQVLGASSNTGQSSSSNQPSSGGSTAYVSSPNALIEMYPGSDRATSPGSPITFQAVIKKNTTANSPLEFSWSYGDGNVGVGHLVKHVYKYPGDYLVVLNVRAGDVFSVSRFKVKVIEANVSVFDHDQYLEIFNNGDIEVNLFNWKIENGGKGFIFQPDTILLSRSSIKLEKNLLKMKGSDNSEGTVLKNSLGQEIFFRPSLLEVDLKEVSKKIHNIEEEILALQKKAKNLGFSAETARATVAVIKNKAAENKKTEPVPTVENIIYEAPQKEGLISKLTNLIKRVFSK